MRTKWNIDLIQKEFEKEEYILLTNNYINNKQKLDFICPNGHRASICMGNWVTGHRCRICRDKATGISKRVLIETIKDSFEKEGYKLLTTEYTENKQKLDFICNKGHFGSISWDKWQQSRRCTTCGNIQRSEVQRFNQEFVEKEFGKEGYTLLSEYINVLTKVIVMCNKGHRVTITYADFQQGHRCSKCYNERRGDILRFGTDHVKDIFSEERYTLLSDYKNAQTPVTVRCPNNHIWKIGLYNFKCGIRCPQCSEHGISKAETEVYDFLYPYFNNIKRNNRTLIPPYEIDIVIPSKKIAIEYCGLYWHSELVGKDTNYHLNKLKMCNEIGYSLITIFEDEWLYKKDIVQNRLRHILNTQDVERIHARKCIIKEISLAIKNEFLDKFHIQGKDTSSIKLGAFYNNTLIAIMTFLSQKDTCYNLSRFCISNYIIPGIASKLFTYFIRNYEFKSIITFGDKRWSTGNVYKKLGFEFVSDSIPRYWYIECNKRIHRFNFRRKVLPNKLEHFDPNLTARENMTNNGYNRIFDCGNSKWRYNRF